MIIYMNDICCVYHLNHRFPWKYGEKSIDLYTRHILQIRRTMDQSCVKVEGAVLGSPSLIVIMVSVDVKQHLKKRSTDSWLRQKPYESRGGRPGLPVPNSSYRLSGRNAAFEGPWRKASTASILASRGKGWGVGAQCWVQSWLDDAVVSCW